MQLLCTWKERLQMMQTPMCAPSCHRYFSIDRVFRNEAIDRTHLAEFHQIEGAMRLFWPLHRQHNCCECTYAATERPQADGSITDADIALHLQ